MPEEDSIEETNSGIKKKGNWKEIAEFGEDVEDAVEGSADEKSVEKFQEWRPRVEESERDVKRKTVKEAKLDENELEQNSKGMTEDLKEASGKAVEAGKKTAKRKNPEKEVKDASRDAARPFYSKLAKLFRRFESFIYSNVVLALNPYYLDTQDFSADIKHRKQGKFEMDISVPKERQRKELKEEFKEDIDD